MMPVRNLAHQSATDFAMKDCGDFAQCVKSPIDVGATTQMD
jgi:hypothetical protein